MTKSEQNSHQEEQRLIGGDALFLGGMMLVFSALCPGFGIIGLVIGLSLITAGSWLKLLARHVAHVPVRVPVQAGTHA